MPKDVKCRNCNNLKHHWCERVVDSPDEDMVRDCQYFWQKTNADRIRAMSDEELADYLYRDMIGFVCEMKRERNESCSEYGCKDCMMEWLQQPAEVDNG